MIHSAWSWIRGRFPQVEALTLEPIIAKYEQLSPREKTITLIATLLIIGLPLIGLMSGARNRLSRLEKKLTISTQAVSEMRGLVGEVQRQEQKIQQIMGRIRPAGNFYLASHMENVATRFGVNMDELSPEQRQDLGEGIEEISVDVKIGRISFTRALDILTDLEQNPMTLMRIRRLRLDASGSEAQKDPAVVDLSFKVSAYVRKTS